MLCLLASGRQNSIYWPWLTLIEAQRGWVACSRTHSMFVNMMLAGIQASGSLTMCLFCFVINCETVFNCYLSLGTSPHPHSPWKKVQCSFISLAAWHLFQVLMAFPIMQCFTQTLGYLSWPLAISESSKNGGFCHLSLNANLHPSTLCHKQPGQTWTCHLSSLLWLHMPTFPFVGMTSYTQVPRLSNLRLINRWFFSLLFLLSK